MVVAAASGALLIASMRVAAQAPSVNEVVQRASSYVREWVPQLANIVSVEHYDQRTELSTKTGTGSGQVQQTWQLTSDVLLVRYPGEGVDWMLFRDVAEADGNPLRHEPDRLLKLFANPSGDAQEQAARITYEGFRYHLAGATVAATNPFLVVALMQEHYQPRLRFRLSDVDRSMGPQVRVVRFDEREVTEEADGRKSQPLPMLFSTAGRIRGSVWLDVMTGQILKTEAKLTLLGKVSSTTTTFSRDPRLGLMLPTHMETAWPRVTGTATYSNYRRFQVQTSTPAVRVD